MPRAVTLEEGEWQALIQLLVNAMIQGNPVLLKVIAQVQQRGSEASSDPGSGLRDQPRGNSHDSDRDAERGAAGRGAETAARPAAD